MDHLGSLMIAPEKDSMDYDQRGRPRQLKTFIIESNASLPDYFDVDGIKASIVSSDIPEIKIIQLSGSNFYTQLYLDKIDERFWILHTDVLAKDALKIISKFVNANKHPLDRTWFPTSMLKEISDFSGNRSFGFGISYHDRFLNESESDVPVGQLKFTIRGSASYEAIKAMRTQEALHNSLAYTRIRVRRGLGHRPDFAEDDITYQGAFVVKDGSSIDKHISLVESARKYYRTKMEEIEDFRIGVKSIDERTLIQGKAFDFEFRRDVEDWEIFFERLLSSTFRLWGLKSKIHDDYYRVLAVDLHTGDPFDMELGKHFMRVYLPKGSCGNVVLRLLVNLQHSFDSNIKCEELGISGAVN
jgi:hypothetical protein